MSRSGWVLIWPAEFSGGGRVFLGFLGRCMAAARPNSSGFMSAQSRPTVHEGTYQSDRPLRLGSRGFIRSYYATR